MEKGKTMNENDLEELNRLKDIFVSQAEESKKIADEVIYYARSQRNLEWIKILLFIIAVKQFYEFGAYMTWWNLIQ